MQKRNTQILYLTISGLLIAVGIVIPMFSPVKIVLEPASFTLASHVAIFIAMFISPYMAMAVAAGTALGFFFGGFPFIIVLRAASHLLFASAGAFYLKRYERTVESAFRLRAFSFAIALVHAASELIVVFSFYFSGAADISSYRQGYLSVFLLVGLGTVIHSMIDFEIANLIRIALKISPSRLSA